MVARHGKGLIIDAMSTFGALEIDARTVAFDGLIAASGKCLEGVPGMGFVLARRAILEKSEGVSHSLAMPSVFTQRYTAAATEAMPTPWNSKSSSELMFASAGTEDFSTMQMP